jgi:hypothetical protein
MMAARGQTYGKRKQQEEAQRAVPMRQAPTDVAAQRARPRPSAPGSLVAPTQRPQEPITAGAPFGPGPMPVDMAMPSDEQNDDDALRELRAIYMLYPSQELADIIQFYEESQLL